MDAPRDPALRTEVVRRRIAFEADPAAFSEHWREEHNGLRQRIQDARLRLNTVSLDDDMLALISRICIEFDVDGLRADLALHRASRALAAWEGRTNVTADDIQRVAQWVLPHRRRRQPFEPPELDQNKLDQIVNSPQQQDNGDDPEDGPDPTNEEPTDSETQTFTASKLHEIKRLRVTGNSKAVEANGGRRNATGHASRGGYSRAVAADRPDDIAVDATLRSAALNGKTLDGKLIIKPENLHQKVRTSTSETMLLFVVDASGSMAAQRRMEAVKGAVLGLLTDAYQQRDQVAVIAFRGTNAELILSPTRSVELAEKQLQHLPTGGRTPLAHALVLAQETLEQATREHPDRVVLTIILSDGKANVALFGTPGDPWQQTQQAAFSLAEMNMPTRMLDTETGFVRVGRGHELAACLWAEYLTLDDLSADALTLTIKQRLG